MKTFAINLRFITGTIERFVVTVVGLRKHVVRIFSTVSKAAEREGKKEKDQCLFFMVEHFLLLCNSYLSIHHFNFNEAAS